MSITASSNPSDTILTVTAPFSLFERIKASSLPLKADMLSALKDSWQSGLPLSNPINSAGPSILTITSFDATGHSLGGACYYVENDGGLLFCGDLLSYGGLISLQCIPGADVHNYAKSVNDMADLKIKSFFPGHLLFSLTDGGRHVREASAAFKKSGVPKNVV